MPRAAGRAAFGSDPAGYAAGRLAYPDALFDWIAHRCDPHGRTAFEIGPGTGQATRAMLDRGVAHLHTIEPDPRLADWLRHAVGDPRLAIEIAAFEDAAPDRRFDLGYAATAFHWVDPAIGLAKIRTMLRPGGTWAMWWTVHARADTAFDAAVDPLFAALDTSPGYGIGQPVPYGLDADARLADLSAAGFVGAEHACFDRVHRFDTRSLVALYATFSQVRRLPAPAASKFLARIARIVDAAGGTVERTVRTPVYLAHAS